MIADLAAKTEQMRAYFKKCTEDARNQYVKRKDKEIASIAGLCINLNVKKKDLLAAANGNEEEREFYDSVLIEFEACGDAMYAAGLIESTSYKQIKEFCQSTGSASDKTVIVEFPYWNAPDDWEDYQELKAACEESGVTWKQAVKIIKNIYREVSGNAR